jgi:hypothetical protein
LVWLCGRAKRPDLQVYVPRGRRQEQETEAADHVVNPKCAATVSEISSGHKESQKVSKSQSSSKSRLVATSDNQITDNPNDCQDLQGNTVAKAGKQSKTCDVKSSRRKSASKVKLSHKIITVTHVSEPPTSTPLKSKTAELELNSGIQPSVETQTKSFSHDASHFKTYHVTSPCDAGVIVPNGTWRTSEEYAFDDLPVLTSHVAYQSELHETNDNSASINVSYQGILLNESHHAEICEEVKMNATSGMSENEISQDDQLTNNNLSPVVNPAPSTSGSQCLLENELCTAVDVALGTTNSSQESSQYTSAICQCKSDSKIRSVCDSLPTDSAVNAHFAPLTALLSLTEKTSCNTEISVESSGPESAGSTKVKLTVPADFDCSVEGEGNKDVDVSMQQVVDTLTASASDDDDWDHIYDDSGNSRISEPDLNASVSLCAIVTWSCL